MRGPATTRSGAMPDSSRAAGLHNVDARVRHHCQGRNVQLPWKGRDVRDRRRGRVPRPGRRQEYSPRPRAHPGRQEGPRQAAAQQRAETAGRLRQTDREVRHRPGDRGPARLHRSPPAHRRPRCRLQGRLPARTRDAADRRPVSGRVQDRRQGRRGHRGCGPDHAAHPALPGDHRRTHGPRRLRPRPRGRGHPHQQPDTRPAHPVPSLTGTRPGAPPRPPHRHLAAGTPRLPGRTAQSRPPQTRRTDPAQGPAHGRPAHRRRLRRTRRTDRRRPGHRHPRHCHPHPGRLPGHRPRPAPGPGSPDQHPAGGSPRS
ncbi:hypothetical protein QFZ49_005401 [Streptomyces turgidiscabies]|uniref:Uncharacterized protein n=1 Tax=Streptomyces turgidiscabies TaxID=85558 RepID=A0ABU0RU00_9ACTN|nr:hypothetical protein [Streptomyces turgidiscabies]